ncbi:MAG: heat shock protein Hsp20 [Acidobacteria bacterium]|nr:heat shock protein Hsp20 [Acidobacteriota bacterium]
MPRNWDPIRDLMLLQDRMNELFENATDRRARERSESGSEIAQADWIPVADVYERAAEFVVAMDLPGVDRAALEIDLENEKLIIKGTRSSENGDQETHRSERPRGRFNRTFGLPVAVDPEQIEAEYKDGVLYVRLPKRKERSTQAVKIKVS